MSIKTVLNDEILSEMDELKKLKPGSDEHKVATEAIVKLYDKAIELEKLEQANEEHEEELRVKREQLEETRNDNYVKNTIEMFGIIAPIVLTIWGTYKTLKFEETGVVTSFAGRNFMNKLFKK